MAIRISSWLSRPGMLRSLFQQARLAVRLLREPRVPLLLKAIPVLALIYLISPLDLIPDILPGLGQLDDLGESWAGKVRWSGARPWARRSSPAPPTCAR